MFAKLKDGTRLFYDCYGSGLCVDGDRVIKKPTLLFLHGGPGLADHTLYTSFWSQLADIAQVIFVDMRGHGRSDQGRAKEWNLSRWGCDIVEFCDAIGVQRPIVAGFSFGGWVALSYAIQFPKHPMKLILCNTEARVDFAARIEAYRQKGGDLAADIVSKLTYSPNKNTAQEYMQHCLPLFSKHPYSQAELNRCIRRTEVWDHFDQEEYRSFNFLPNLGKICCPTLVLAGDSDPEHPLASSKALFEGLIHCHAKYALIADAGDPVYRDQPKQVLHALKAFITNADRDLEGLL